VKPLNLMILALALCPPLAAGAAPAANCATPEYRQLDFWVGDWDTFEADASSPASEARNHVSLILDDCVIYEIYADTGGMTGESFSIYDSARKLWHQTWVTTRGHLLVLEGRMQGGRMVLLGDEPDADGRPAQQRVSWWPMHGGVRELGESSHDGGKSWTTDFDIVFRPHAASASAFRAKPWEWGS